MKNIPGMFKRKSLALGVAAILATTVPAALADNDASVEIDISRQQAGMALLELSKRTGSQIVLAEGLGESVELPALKGEYTLITALDTMLKDSGLIYEVVSDDLVLVKEDESEINVDEEQKESEEVDEEIIVTGSRIARTPSQIAANVIRLNAQDLRATGSSTLEGALRKLPQNVFGATPIGATVAGSASFNGAINIAGASSINLRGLGAESTLILVDGRRIGDSGVFGGVTDITGIPLRAIEKVEIMLDGASSIYGSDAVGGVVNIILKKDFDGSEINYRYGAPQAGGFEEHVVTASGSWSWGNGKLRATFERYQNSNLDGQERPQSIGHSSTPDTGVVNGFEPLIYTYEGQDYLPSQFFPLVGLPADSPWWLAFGLIPFTDMHFNSVLPENYDGSNLSQTDVILLDQVNFSNLDLFVNRDASGGLSVVPAQKRHNLQLGFDQEVQLWGREATLSGTVYYSTRDTYAANGAFSIGSSYPVGHSVNPFESQMVLNRRLESLPARHYQTTTNVARWTLSLNGAIGENWRWSVGADGSQTKMDGAYFNDPIPAIYGTDTLFTELVDSGLNLLVGDVAGNNSPELLNQLVIPQANTNSVNRSNGIDFNASGAIFHLPGGDASLSIGADWRRTQLKTSSERSIVAPGGIESNNALNAIGQPSLLQGDFQVPKQSDAQSAVFAELWLPVFSADNAITGIERLYLNGSARYDSHNGRDSGSTWSLGMVWSPVDQVTFRFRHNTSFVMPGFRDKLRETTITDFPIDFPDRFPNGRPMVILDDLSGQQVGVDFVGLRIGGGNPDLQPETADIQTAGIEFTPDFLPGLTLKATWQQTVYSNRIGPPVLSFVPARIDASIYEELFGEGQIRDDRGLIIIDSRTTNTSYEERSGFDYGLDYNRDTDIGQFNLGVNIARTGKHITVQKPGDDPVSQLADVNFRSLAVVPTYRYSANLSWFYRGLSVDLNVATSSDTVSTQQSQGVSSQIQRTVKYAVDANLGVTYDLDQAGWLVAPDWLKGTAISLTVTNLLHDYTETTKIDLITGETGNAELNANVSDPYGRFFKLDVTKRF